MFKDKDTIFWWFKMYVRIAKTSLKTENTIDSEYIENILLKIIIQRFESNR